MYFCSVNFSDFVSRASQSLKSWRKCNQRSPFYVEFMRKFVSFILFLTIAVLGFSQTAELTFVGRDAANQYVKLDSIKIMDHTQGWNEILYYPDTVLRIQNNIGIENYTGGKEHFILSQNTPNPFDGKTQISLSLSETEQVNLQVFDVNGKLIFLFNINLDAGIHLFRVSLAKPQTYFFTAKTNKNSATIKMLNTGNGNSNTISYIGSVEKGRFHLKSDIARPVSIGDEMEYVGFSTLNDTMRESAHQTRELQGVETIVLHFDAVSIQCQTLFDYDGNAYSTVVMGNQCWMRENLRTTHTSMGVLIDDYAYPDHPYSNPGTTNDMSLVAPYGLLYNWNAMMNGAASSNAVPSGVQGICPDGWHLPSDREWKQLEVFAGMDPVEVNDSGYRSNMAITLCDTLGWLPSDVLYAPGNMGAPYRNVTGFSARPAGVSDDQMASWFGECTFFWTASTITVGGTTGYWYRSIWNNAHTIVRDISWPHMRFSVRCVRDEETYPAEPISVDIIIPPIPTLGAVVTDSVVSQITSTSAVCGGTVTSDGNSEIAARGVCWNVGPASLNTAHTTDGSGLGGFSSNLTGLSPDTRYYVVAYVTNSVGTAYGQLVTFRTLSDVPYVNTAQPTNVAQTSFAAGGNVLAANCSGTVSRGICWNTTGNPTLADNHIASGTGTGSFVCNVTGLDCSTNYYVRAYATNNMGTAYGEEFSVTTLDEPLPPVTTLSIENYGGVGMIVRGEVQQGFCEEVSAKGICYSTSPNPTITDGHTENGDGYGVFSDTIVGLESGNTYYARTYATNSAGTAYGEELNVFVYYPPIVTTDSVTGIVFNSAICGGTVTMEGYAAVTDRGVCWSTSPNPTINDNHTTDGAGLGNFTSSLTGLSSSTTYYVRAYAANNLGTSYGEQRVFSTPFNCGTSIISDIDGNAYNTVQIGTQCWTKENMKTTKFADGTDISQGQNTNWHYPNNSAANKEIYGLLYSSVAVTRTTSDTSNHIQGICPTGWHVPNDEEWKWMEIAVGISQNEADSVGLRGSIAAQLSDNTGWISSAVANAAGDLSASERNASGFSALPAGKTSNNTFFGYEAHFWSAVENSSSAVYNRYLVYDHDGIGRSNDGVNNAYSVRCVRDIRDSATAVVPTVITSNVSDMSQVSQYDSIFEASCGGEVTAYGGAVVTARGICWSTSPNPTINDSHTTDGIGTGSFSSSLMGLASNTTYFVRAYATNRVGTAYGNQICFTTPSAFICGISTVSDVDGNVYKTVQIGNQCWMKENMRATRYADSTLIELNGEQSTTVPYIYYPGNSSSNVAMFGLLYNWVAAMHNSASSSQNPSGVQGICPTGWHLPSSAEWAQLTNYVSSQSEYLCGGIEGNIAKSLADTTCWVYTGWGTCASNCCPGYDPPSNNSTGFSALPVPCGQTYVRYWSTSRFGDDQAYYLRISAGASFVDQDHINKSNGYPVRCLRD